MGGDLLPIPIVRLRGKEPVEAAKQFFLGDGGYDLPRTVNIKNDFLPWLKLVGNMIVCGMMIIYVAYADKGYLAHASIQGYSRTTLQHPVDHCNPLHSQCKTDFKSVDELEYCTAKHTHMGADDNAHEISCKYLDTFDVDSLNSGMLMGNIIIPTRISTFHQKKKWDCARTNAPCKKPYDVTEERHEYVADIEDFTFLIDHGFSCPELGLKGASWATLGFYIPFMNGTTDWGFPQKLLHKRMKPKYVPCEDPNDRSCFYSKEHQETRPIAGIPLPKMPNLLNRTLHNYDSTGSGPIVSTSYGDVVKVSDLLHIAGINLDEANFGKNSLRKEGEVIVIQIDYTNYNYFHWPNALEPVYEYRIFRIPADSYKFTRIQDRGNGERDVIDVHGIEIITRVTGTLGKLSLKNLTVSLVELSVLLGFVSWMLHCAAVNFGGNQGDQLMKALTMEIHVDDDDFPSGDPAYTGFDQRNPKE